MVPILVAFTGCAAAVEAPRLEDQARREMPVAVCLKALERYGSGGVVPALKPPDYWSMVLPGYDPAAKTVDTSEADCAGRYVFSSSALGSARGGIVAAADEQARVADAPGKFKIVWLQTHSLDGGQAAGPLALVRALEGRAEVYAIGMHHGPSDTTRFELERVGPNILITASDGGCSAAKAGQDCETSLRVLLMRMGRLSEAARITTDRVQHIASGGAGPVEYRFSAIPDFGAKGFRLLEQVVLQDPAQPAVQKSTQQRSFQLVPEGKLIAKQESLWKRVVPGQTPGVGGDAP